MRLGIDFGTTRTVVAAADRGNYPVISFHSETGDTRQWYPSLVGGKGEELVFALDAEEHLGEPGWHFLRSLKRRLGDAAPDMPVQVGEATLPALDLLTRYLSALRRDLSARSNLSVTPKQALEALIGVPANANSNQRFLTMEGFRRAGFKVLGMINEPSAAGIEFAHQNASNDWTARKEYLIVYDLGGGTFDASVIGRRDRYHEIVTDEGISELGGDDFDAILTDLVIHSASSGPMYSSEEWFHLLEDCRQQKESLHPNTRKIAVDLSRIVEGGETVIVTTEDFYERCEPLVERTVAALEAAMERATSQAGITWSDIALIYLVGGSSDFPIVGRILRQHYGRRVRRSPYPFSATAIGLAIAADAEAGHRLRERFTRHFGVWREAQSGHKVVFDPIFGKDTLLPLSSEPPLHAVRRYQPAHNIGHFRYLECSHLTESGQPGGDITPWDEIVFSLDPALQHETEPARFAVFRSSGVEHQVIEEQYQCSANGVIEVTIANLTAGYRQSYRLREATNKRRMRSRKREP